MQEKILEMIEMISGEDVSEDMDIDFFEEGLIDSLGVIDLLVKIQQFFGIKLAPTEIQRDEIATPNKLIVFLKSRGIDE